MIKVNGLWHESQFAWFDSYLVSLTMKLYKAKFFVSMRSCKTYHNLSILLIYKNHKLEVNVGDGRWQGEMHYLK